MPLTEDDPRYATALREWRPLAEQGHAAAQVNRARVLALAHVQTRHGGHGALYVLLRRKR